jgi:hypothetical protein
MGKNERSIFAKITRGFLSYILYDHVGLSEYTSTHTLFLVIPFKFLTATTPLACTNKVIAITKCLSVIRKFHVHDA